MKKFKLISLLFKTPNPVFYEVFFVLINVVAITYSIIVGFKWYYAAAAFLSGMFLWVLLEYLIHRFIFHFKSNNPIIRKIIYSIHGVHHAHSQDDDKMYVPLIPAVIMAALLLHLLVMLIGVAGFPLFAGIIFMHQIYNYVHIMIHTNAYKDNKILKGLRENHIKHHTGYGEKCFGVTSTICDKIFNTL